MPFFTLDSIRDVLASDLARIASESQSLLTQLLERPGNIPLLNEAIRQAHAMKGACSMVGAFGLANLGSDWEHLYRHAAGLAPTQPEHACVVYQFILDRLPHLHWMIERTLENQFDAAQQCYDSIRTQINEVWPGVVPPATFREEVAARAPTYNSDAVFRDPAPPAALDSHDPPPHPDPVPAPSVPPQPAPLDIAPVALAPPPHPLAEPSSDLPPPVPLGFDVAPSSADPSDTLPPADPDLQALFQEEVVPYLTELTQTFHALAAPAARAQPQPWQAIRRLFHTIKGSSASVGLSATSHIAREAEFRAREAEDLDDSRTLDTAEFLVLKAAAVAQSLSIPFESKACLDALQGSHSRPAPSAPAESLSNDDTLDESLLDAFSQDATEQLDQLERTILRWERNENPEEQAKAARRAFHTLKGAASSVGLKRLGASLHLMEDHLDDVGRRSGEASTSLFTLLLTCLDDIRRFMDNLRANPATPWTCAWESDLRSLLQRPPRSFVDKTLDTARSADSTAPSSLSPAPTPDPHAQAPEERTLRVEADRLLQLINLVSELVIDRNRMEKTIAHLAQLQKTLNGDQRRLVSIVEQFQHEFEFTLLRNRAGASSTPTAPSLPASRNDRSAPADASRPYTELEFDRYDQFNILSRTLTEAANDMHETIRGVSSALTAFSEDNAKFSRISRQLQDQVTRLTLLPIGTLLPRLERAFRDAVREEHKEADLSAEGETTLLDKTIVDRVYGPLLHLVRNAASHGIETPDIREARGKPRRGSVRIAARQTNNQVVLDVVDDGSGLHLDAIRRRAIERGFLPADAPPLTKHQAVDFLFRPGFSTAERVTSVSGRGVGMDVVRKEIESLNGSLEVATEPGQGTTWTMRLPLTLSISEAILGQVAGQIFAFPLNYVETGIILQPDMCEPQGAPLPEFYNLDDQVIPIIRLSQVLRLPGQPDSLNGLIVAAGDQRAVLIADRLVGRSEIVIRKLDSILTRHPFLNGATINTEGRVVLILNIPALLAYGRVPLSIEHLVQAEREAPQPPPALIKPRVLVVDDSLSVRKVQERLLNALGCDPILATDGEHALNILRTQKADIVLTDLEMPRLNGYDLISEIRRTPAWNTLPIIVISSRNADRYITQAMHLGANSFLSKPFTEDQISRVLHHFLRWEPTLRLPTA